MMYDELIKNLRETDFSDGCPCGAENLCKDNDCLIWHAADAIEKLQLYESLYKDLTEKSQKVATELKQQLQKSEEDNVNLTGWLAEEHAKVEELQGELQALKDDTDMAIVEDGKTTRLCFVKKWIPVTERLPESRGHYFVHVDVGEFEFVSYGTLAYFDGKIFRWELLGNENWEEVTHWMPLPEPPESEE